MSKKTSFRLEVTLNGVTTSTRVTDFNLSVATLVTGVRQATKLGHNVRTVLSCGDLSVEGDAHTLLKFFNSNKKGG